jgi:hypothetical protein
MSQIKRTLVSMFFVSATGLLLSCPIIAQSSERLLPKQTYADLVTEQFSFLIKEFKMNHQGETNNLNITIRYRYVAKLSDSKYPDFRLIARDIETFLTNYPNENDYWEVLNKKITLLVLDKNSSMVKVTSQLQVSPSSLDPYLRSTTVTRERGTGRSNIRPVK